jgi:hypothetical protein
MGTDKEGGERLKGGHIEGRLRGREDTGRGDRQGGGMDREGVWTGRGYRQEEGGPSFVGGGPVRGWGGGRCRPRELEGGGRGGRSLRAVV